MKLQLPHVTLIAPTGTKILETISAIEKSCSGIDFGAVKLVVPEKPDNLPDYITFEQGGKMDSYFAYNEYVFKELYKHVDTSHCLLIQHDSWVLYPTLWDPSWLWYDYIGAPWEIRENSYISWETKERVRVGNGGFSLRSKKLLSIPSKYNLPLLEEQGYYNEDGNICCYHRHVFIENGIKYAPIEVAASFSYETPMEENMGIMSFGFHKNYPSYAWR